MYIPTHFAETSFENIKTLISDFPLSTLVVDTQEGLVAYHIPILMEGDDLIGHIAKANDLHRMIVDGTEILTIFQGDDAYISPNWYPSKKVHGEHVPTWNYVVAHVYGDIHFYTDVKTKRAIVGKMTKHFETRTNGSDAWRMSDAPKDYLDKLLDNIVAFKITTHKILGKTKASQNRTPEDRKAVFDKLSTIKSESKI